MNKFNKKNDNNKKKKSFNKGGHDELEDIKTKLQTLQNILKYLPNDSKTSCNNNNNDINESEMEAICSGFLVVVGGNISEATRFYAELVNNILYLKREPNSKIKHVITISFIQSNVFDNNNNNNNENEEKEKNAKYMDLFVAHLESRSANNSFKLFSPIGIYVISSSCDRDKKRFCNSIEEELLSLFSNETWIAKQEACKQLLPIERSQFEIQIERHEQIMNSLTLTGLAHNVGLLGSSNKEKSGVMRILKHTHSNSHKHHSKKHHKWEDHFFVLAHSTLYYFQHDPDAQITHSSMPKSFIPLKYANIQLDIDRIKSDRFVFYISTPLRTVYLRCRHPVALAEWVSSLLKAINRHTNNNNNNALKLIESKDILNKIRIIRSKVSTLNNLLKEKKGIKIFDNYLKNIKLQSILRCWLAILHWKQNNIKKNKKNKKKKDNIIINENKETNDIEEKKYENNNNIEQEFNSIEEAQIIFEQYINDKGKNKKKCIWKCLDEQDYNQPLIKQLNKYIYFKQDQKHENDNNNNNIETITQLFDEILELLDEKLDYEFQENFQETNEYMELQKQYDSTDKYLPLPLNRNIINFEENSILTLVITNTDLSTKEIKLSTKKTVATIGRDCSNCIVLDDAHVSRSHARIQYNEYEAYFTDLGSHHGSYLNGNRVLHERLSNGDRLKIGGCDVVFKVKIKKNIMNKVFNKFLSSNSSKHRETVSSVAFM